MTTPTTTLTTPVPVALLAARDHDPFATLGLHCAGKHWFLHVYRPDAADIDFELGDGSWQALPFDKRTGLYRWEGDAPLPRPWRLRIGEHVFHDPYAFPPATPADDLFLFNAGRLRQAWRTLGANPQTRDGIAGVCFRVWAPNAERVSVVGDFNQWDGRLHPMCNLGASGVWELFIPGLTGGALYRFEIRTRNNGAVIVKNDP